MAEQGEGAHHHEGSIARDSVSEDVPVTSGPELVVPIAPVHVTRSTLPSLLMLLVPSLLVVRVVFDVVQGDARAETVVGLALALLLALAYARPVRLIGQDGEVRFTPEGMRVRFDGLLTEEWFVPKGNICEVRCADRLPGSSDRGVLGLTGRDADVAVRFLVPSSRVPVRGGFFVPAFLGLNRRSGTMPVPNTTVSEIVWRAGVNDLPALQARIGAALSGEPTTGPLDRSGSSSTR